MVHLLHAVWQKLIPECLACVRVVPHAAPELPFQHILPVPNQPQDLILDGQEFGVEAHSCGTLYVQDPCAASEAQLAAERGMFTLQQTQMDYHKCDT
jgi:hypothetical protein